MLQVLNGPVIEAGESESDGIDCSAGQLVRITMPPGAWDGDAPLTLLFSSDGTFFNEMYNLDGFPVKINVVVPGSGVIIPEHVGRAVAWLKLRSGHEYQPVVQRHRQQFAVTILVPDDGAVVDPPTARGGQWPR
jgi:hypothetical protein